MDFSIIYYNMITNNDINRKKQVTDSFIKQDDLDKENKKDDVVLFDAVRDNSGKGVRGKDFIKILEKIT